MAEKDTGSLLSRQLDSVTDKINDMVIVDTIPPPQNLVASGFSGGVQLSWDDVDPQYKTSLAGSVIWRANYSLDSHTEFAFNSNKRILAANVKATFFVDLTSENEVQYIYWVQHMNTDGTVSQPAGGKYATKTTYKNCPLTLSDTTNLQVDLTLGSYFRVLFDHAIASRTISFTGAKCGQKVILEMIQSATGGELVTYESRMTYGVDIPTCIVSTISNVRDFLGLIYNDLTDKFYAVAWVRTYPGTVSGSGSAGDAYSLQGYVPGNFVFSTISVICVTPVSGGGTLTGNVTISMTYATLAQDGYLKQGDWSVFNAKAPTANATFTGTTNFPGNTQIGSDGKMGIGAAVYSAAKLYVSSVWGDSYGESAIYVDNFIDAPGDISGFTQAIQSSSQYTGSHTLSFALSITGYAIAALVGYYGGSVATGVGGAGHVASAAAMAAQNLLRSGISVDDSVGIILQPANSDVGPAATVTRAYGAYMMPPSGCTPSTVYGYYCANLGGGNWGIYLSGNSKSYLGGNVGIGKSPGHLLDLNSDDAYKPTTNTWGILSDARIKTKQGDFTDGLSIVRSLRPIVYRYNERGEHWDDLDHIGFFAQDLMEVASYMVEKTKGMLDGELTDLYGYQGHALPYILVNAVNELDARLSALEARLAAHGL